MSTRAEMIGGTLAQTSVVDRKLLATDWGFLRLSRDGVSHGEAMPDRTALIEAQISGLRRFACALLRGDSESADDLVQDTLERALSRWHLRRNEENVRGWLYTILLRPLLDGPEPRQAARST